MSIFENLVFNRSCERRYERLKIDLDYRKTDIKNLSIPVQTKYVATLTIGCEFWANSAQLEDGKKRAERYIASTLYADVIKALDSAAMAIFNDEKDSALKIIDEIRTKIIR